ncbi:hypothetical protein PHLCEN_2v8002 [Hermanssonia centrifuga]|uniref:Uncharacterized protein n=1 Tax=Hermanssonia centrifuga TaxID=98765 RepID=A0A2R6NUY0_9APHY|nr:hypothetical protein PHLCEN_2v8002 [Hermanssonia centrifuga]
MAKTVQKKKAVAVAPPPRLSTRAKNASAHPGLVDLSEDSDPERTQRNSKRKAVRAKAKKVKEKKGQNLAEMEQLILKLQNEIAKRDAEVVNTRVECPNMPVDPEDSELVHPMPASSPIEETEEPVVPPSSPIEEVFDADVVMSDGRAESASYEPSRPGSPFQADIDFNAAASDMEAEETDVDESDVPMIPGGPLRRTNAAFFGRNHQGGVVALDRTPSRNSYALDKLPKKQNQPKKRKATANEDDLPEAPCSSKAAGKKVAKPIA